MSKQRVFLVLGMHRGGTSTIARALRALGVPLGDQLLPPTDANPRGYWEDVEVVAINEELLRHFHSAWDRLELAWNFTEPDPAIGALQTKAAHLIRRRVSAHKGIWGFKDPRTARLVRFWQQVIESCELTPNYVLALRNPMSVALSLKKRDGISVEKSWFLWIQHMVPAVLRSTGSRCVVDYDSLLNDPATELNRISRAFAPDLPERDDAAIAEFTGKFLETGLRHTEFTSLNLRLDCRVPNDVVEAYELLSRVAKDEICLNAPEVRETFQAIHSRLAGYSTAFHYAGELESDKALLSNTLHEREASILSLDETLVTRGTELSRVNRTVLDRDLEIASLNQSLSERESQIALLKEAALGRNGEIALLKQATLERDGEITFLKQAASEHDREISFLRQAASERALLKQAASERDGEITFLKQAASERDGEITFLKQAASERDGEISFLKQAASERTGQIALLKKAASERDSEISLLKQEASERDRKITLLKQEALARTSEIALLKQAASERERKMALLKQRASERDSEIAALNQVSADHLAQVLSLTQIVSEREGQIDDLRIRELALRSSMSWRVTAPLRSVYGLLLNTRSALRGTPSPQIDPPLGPPEIPSSPAALKQADPSPEPPLSAQEWTGDFIEDSPPPIHFNPDIKLVAFYLPQFHPIPENDDWWGKGFTEWTNVARAKAQFVGHYQPHLPGELGFYDLRVEEIQARQVALARRYGIGAFCFYFYWFAGKRLLELPVRQYLENPELTLPFCLCWANEDWTRRWDGAGGETLIMQEYSAEDDISFIQHVAQYMRDPRYLRIDARPVLLVHRPSCLPDARATAARWREWTRQNGLGDLYLIYSQSFDKTDPADYGFDAATEFPPNLSDPPVMTDQIQRVNPDFSGIAYDWRILVERSRHYSTPDYKLFRGVCPSWDNVSRCPDRGTVFIHSSPEAYREWLQNAVAETRGRLLGAERLVFINAWNEWAEGAHLEPDSRYGYAWLQATRDALMPAAIEEGDTLARIVVVTHDAYPHGAQFIALNIARELVGSLGCKVEIVCLGDGPLTAEFAKYGRVHSLAGLDPRGPEASKLAADLFERGFQQALVNTTVCGHFLATLKQSGTRCVALVHELRGIILSYSLRAQAQTLAEHADYVVFPAAEVQHSFREFASISPDKIIVQPQGLFKPNPYRKGRFSLARRRLRRLLGVPEDARLILGVGYADHRKGVDYFAEIAAKVIGKDPQAHFVWVGALESAAERDVAAVTTGNPGILDHMHFVGHQDDTALYYAGADVFALTSREDPFPSVVLEAIDAGLPIIAFLGSGGSNELVEEGLGANVPMGDCSAFAEVILELGADSTARENITRRGRTLIAERFSFRQYVFELLKLAGAPLFKVSVVVPNFNYERYLPDRIATVLGQTYPIYELIFLDDASDDDSVGLASRLLETAGIDYRIVPNHTNSGSVFLQWKLGTERARGEIVWIAEADDLSEPNFLATVLRGFEDPGVVLSYCESKQIDGAGCILAEDYGDYVADLGRERWKRPYLNNGEDEICNYLAVKNTIPNVSAVLMRRDELAGVLDEHIREISSYKVTGDWKTYLYLLSKGRLAFFPQSLNLHRRHPGGVTISSFNESQFREIQAIQEWVAKRHRVPTNVRQSMRQYLRFLSAHFGLRDTEQSDHAGKAF